VGKRVKKGVDIGEVANDYSVVGSVTISFFWNVTVEGELSRKAHVKTQGGSKICICMKKERFPGKASENRSNRAEYLMTKVQLGAEVLR